MSNPYDSPQSSFPNEPSGSPQGPQGLDSIGRTSFVGQVTIVAILMILHGLLVMVMGGGVAMFGLVPKGEFDKAFEQQRAIQKEVAKQRREKNPDQEQIPEFDLGPEFAQAIKLGLLGLAGLCLFAGLLSIVAGVMNLRYKGRGLGIFSLFFGFAASLTCYCAPTAIAMGIYGLIVYFNSDVARAFELVKQGYTPAQVKDAAHGIDF